MFKKNSNYHKFYLKKKLIRINVYWKEQITQSRSTTEEVLALEWSHNKIISWA